MVGAGGTDDIDDSRTMHVGMLLRCFLCQEPLPVPNWNTHRSFHKDFYPEWKGHLVSVFPYTALDGSIHEQLRSIHLEEIRDRGIRYPNSTSFWTQNPLSKELFVEVCQMERLSGDYCDLCGTDRMVYLSHRDCWKVAFSSHQWSSLDWSRLAVQTRPFETRAYEYNQRPLVYHEVPGTPILSYVVPEGLPFHSSTPLGMLLTKTSTLPPELQIQIMDLLKGTLFASLLQTKSFVSEMLPRLKPDSTWTIQPHSKPLRSGGEESNSSLSCRFMNISGSSYLSELTLGQLDGPASRIAIANKAVQGLQFALGRFGLRGVRISYDDDSYSPWIGQSSSCWVGTVLCSDLSKLSVLADELRIIRVDTVESGASHGKTSVMWWEHCPPAFCSTRHVTTCLPTEVVQYYPNWRQYQYLPLSFGSEYASGLTVYMSWGFSSIIGLVSHGSSDYAIGTTNFVEDEYGDGPGCPIHLALSPGEYITSAWLHNKGFGGRELHGPLALGTNLGRFQHFGTHGPAAQLDLHTYGRHESSWVRLSMGRSAKVHGLAVEVPQHAKCPKSIDNFGVSQDKSLSLQSDAAIKPPLLPIHPPGPTLPSPQFASHLRRQEVGYGFSAASLDNIATLHVRKKILNVHNERVCGCVGLRIVHQDSTIEILGRWDPRDKDSISKIYDSSEGILTRISFHMAEIGRCKHVENITVGITDNPLAVQPLDASSVVPMDPPNNIWTYTRGYRPTALTNTRTFDCFQTNQRAAWWFTFNYDDIGRDLGSPAIQSKEDTDLFFGEQYEALQLE